MGAISMHAVRSAVRPVAVATSGRRWLALDLLRFLAVLLMVQGHTFTALIEDTIRPLSWFRWHSYIHGYTAPLFMFSAGLAFGVTTLQRWDTQTQWGPAVRKRVTRYLLIVAIGYALQLPSSSLLPVLHGLDPDRTARLLAVNALQLIGVTLLACQLLALVVRDRERFVGLSALAGGLAVLAGPFFWRWPLHEHLPTALAAYLTNQTGSLFPLVPWSGFLFAGIVTAWLVGDVSDPRRRAELAPKLALAGGALAVLAFALDHSGLSSLFGEHNFWKTSPWFFLWRLGCILPVLGAFCVFEQWHRRRARGGADGPMLATVRVMGQESLVIYVAHLLLLYGIMLPWGMSTSWSHALGLADAILAFAGLFLLMLWLSRLWHHTKTQRPQHFDTLRWVLAAAAAVLLLTPG